MEQITEDPELEALVRKLWKNIDKSGGPDACWPWTGFCRQDGYGLIFTNFNDGSGRTMLVHRLVYILEVDNLSDKKGYCVTHVREDGGRCEHKCCNPKHLKAIPRKELKKTPKKYCIRGHLLPLEPKKVGNRMLRICPECHKPYKDDSYARVEKYRNKSAVLP